MMADNDYIQDKLWIAETLKRTSHEVTKLFEKFEDFKVEVTKDIAVIQAKLLIYVTVAASGISVIVSVLSHFIGK